MDLIQTVLSLANPIREWFQAITQHRQERDDKVREAIRALYVALNETRIYIGYMTRPPYASSAQLPHKQSRKRSSTVAFDPFIGPFGMPVRRHDEREAGLSRLWMDAALKLREVNPALATRCDLKASYWANPEEWVGRDACRAHIEINQMSRAARRLLTAN
jgi:hypothetical protein